MSPETERGHVPPARRATPAAPHQPAEGLRPHRSTQRRVYNILFHKNVLNSTKHIKWDVWYRKNVLGGTKSSSLVSCPAPPARPASPRHETLPNKKSGQLIQLTAFRADGETRTHTGQRPLPPQSSVSTISPHPHVWMMSLSLWDCKYRYCLWISKIFSQKITKNR